MARSAGTPAPAYDPPGSRQLEISLFGPGYGECVVVHYGEGKWFTVDSCLGSDRETPAALDYLRTLGLDPGQCVSHVVLTHPDGDHIGGIADLYLACASARLVCATVLAERSAVSYAAYYAHTDPTTLTQTTRELHQLLSDCVNRPPYNCPLYVKQDTLIVDDFGVRVTALAPSDLKHHRFLTRIAAEIPKAKSERRGARHLTPNEASAALLLETEGFSVLLGADLEETPGSGWTEIMNSSIAYRRSQPASVFKVAHHGSSNADCPNLWRAMADPVAILAPFRHGRHAIPTRPDVARIRGYTARAFSVSSFRTQKIKRLSRVDRSLLSLGAKRRDLFPKHGHIRVRIDSEGARAVDLFDSAVHLSRVH